MPCIDPPRAASATPVAVTQVPAVKEVNDWPLTFNVRRLGTEILVRVEVLSFEHDSAAAFVFPRIKPATAMLLAKALIEAATGTEVDIDKLGSKAD